MLVYRRAYHRPLHRTRNPSHFCQTVCGCGFRHFGRHYRRPHTAADAPLPRRPSIREWFDPVLPFGLSQNRCRLLKNSPVPASEPLFSPNSPILEVSEPDLSPSMYLSPTFATGWFVFVTLPHSLRFTAFYAYQTVTKPIPKTKYQYLIYSVSFDILFIYV